MRSSVLPLRSDQRSGPGRCRQWGTRVSVPVGPLAGRWTGEAGTETGPRQVPVDAFPAAAAQSADKVPGGARGSSSPQNYVTTLTSPSAGWQGVCLRPRSEAPGREPASGSPLPSCARRGGPCHASLSPFAWSWAAPGSLGAQSPGPQPCTLPSGGLGWGPESGHVCKACRCGPRGHRCGGAGHPFLMVSIAGAATCPRVGRARLWGPWPVWGVPSRGEPLEVKR